MNSLNCPNYDDCKLINDTGFIISSSQKRSYVVYFCKSKNCDWQLCKRYIVKNTMHFCPDFVLPDSPLSADEIIDKFDKEI